MKEKTPKYAQETTKEITAVVCNMCGCRSTLPQVFRSTFGKRYCPACSLKLEVKRAKFWYVILAIFVLYDLLRGGFQFGLASLETWTTLLIIVISILTLIFHEFAHAIGAWLTGGRVFGFHFGLGTVLLRQWLGNLYIGLSKYPVSGICFAAFPTQKFSRLRYGIYISSGLLFHLIVLAVLIPILSQSGNWNGLPLIRWTVLVNGIMLLFNLWPQTFMTVEGKSDSDGKKIWRLISGQIKTNEIHQLYYRHSARFAYQRGDMEHVDEIIEQGLINDPNDSLLENIRAYQLIKNGRLDEAQNAWKKIVEIKSDTDPISVQHAVSFNNYAWVTLMNHPSPESLQTARGYAENAYSMAPWLPYIRGTMAAVLVESGEYDAGIDLALKAVEEMKSDKLPFWKEDAASILAISALGYFRQGEEKLANKYLSEAQLLAPNEMAVKKVVAEMSL